MPKWDEITRNEKYQNLPPEARAQLKTEWFKANLLPEIESKPSLKEMGADKVYEWFMQQPDDTGQGYVTSMLGAAGRGFGEMVPGAIEGVGALTGSEGLREFGQDVRGGLESISPVNPIYGESIPVKLAGVGGQVGSMLATAGAGGLAGKALGGVGAVSKGAQTAALGSAFLQGSAEGARQAEEYGMSGPEAYLRTLAGGVTEAGTEILPFGMAAETALAKRLLTGAPRTGTFLGAVGSEAGEEGLGQIASNIATKALAPAGVETPDITEGALEAAAYGAAGGAMIGGVNALISTPPERQTQIQKDLQAEAGAIPKDTVPDQTNEEKVTAMNAGGTTVVDPEGKTAVIPPAVAPEETPSMPLPDEIVIAADNLKATENAPFTDVTGETAAAIIAENAKIASQPAIQPEQATEETGAEVTPETPSLPETGPQPVVDQEAPAVTTVQAAPIQPEPIEPQENAPSQIPLEESVRQEPQDRIESREAEGPSSRDQLRNPAEGEGEGEVAPIEPTVENIEVATPYVTGNGGQRGEIQSENGDEITVEWRDGTTTTVKKSEVVPRTATEQTIKNKTQISQTSTSSSDRFTVFYYDENGEVHNIGSFLGETEASRDRAFERALALAEKNAREHNHANVYYREKRLPVKKSPSTPQAPTSATTPTERAATGEAQGEVITSSLPSGRHRFSKAKLSKLPKQVVDALMQRKTSLDNSFNFTSSPSIDIDEDSYYTLVNPATGESRRLTTPGEFAGTATGKNVVKPTANIPLPKGAFVVYQKKTPGGDMSLGVIEGSFEPQEPAITSSAALEETPSQTTKAAAETQTPESVGRGLGGSRVVQSEPSEGSIPEVEKVSPETETTSRGNLPASEAAMSYLMDDLTDAQKAKWTPEMFAAAQAYFDGGGKDFESLQKVVKFPRVVSQAYLKADKAASEEQDRIDKAQRATDAEMAKAEREEKKLQAEMLRREEMRSKAIDSIIGAAEKKKRQFGQVTNSDAISAVAMLVSSKDVPGVLTTWWGTKEDFLRDPANQTADPEIYARIKAGELVEGFFNKGRSYVFLDGIGVSENDMLRGEQMSVTPQVAAVRRVLLHESLVHRGIHGLPLRHRRLILNWVRQNSTPQELDELAQLYTEYANWRNSEYQFEALAEELLAKKVDSLTEIPKDGPMAKLMDILRQIWDFIVGYKREPTLSDLKSVVKLLKSGAEALANDRLKDGGEVKLSYAGEKAIENLPEERRQFMRDSLDAAKAMATAGKDSEEIRAVTGWFPGKYDGKMRWEVPDADFLVDANVISEMLSGKRSGALVGELIAHPSLFNAYPEIKDLAVVFADTGDASAQFTELADGVYAIRLNREKWSPSSILHEIQHWIQAKEGFARGSSRNEFIISEGTIRPPEYTKDATSRGLNADQAYNRTAGEIEARDVQARQKLRPEQRAATAPYSSENIAPEDAIVLFGSGPQASVQFASDTSAAFSAGNEAARSTLYSERDMDIREAIRRAYEAMPKQNSVAVPIGELFDKTKELMPGVTQDEFSLVLQDLFEDNGAVLQEGESDFFVTTPEGKRAGFVVVMPRAAKASRIKAEGPAVSKLQENVRNIDEGSVKADFEGVQFKDTKPNQRTVKPKQSYTEAAVQFVDSLQGEGNSLEDIAYSIQSPDFIEGLGIERDLSMQDAIGLEVRNRINKALREEKNPSVKARLNKLNLSLSKFWQGIGSMKGQHLAIRQKLIADPRYRWMFIKDKAEVAMKEARENVATANITSTDDLTNQMNREGEKADEQSGEQNTNKAADLADDVLMEEGEALLNEENKGIWNSIKNWLRQLAILARIDAEDVKAGSKASRAENEEFYVQMKKLSKEERQKKRNEIQNNINKALKKLKSNLTESEQSKVDGMVEIQKRRGPRTKGAETKADLEIKSIMREMNKARPGQKPPLSKQISWKQIFSQKAKTVEEYRQRIYDAISANEAFQNLSDEQKGRLSDLFSEAWESKRKDILERMLTNLINKEEAAKRISQKGAQALREQSQRLVEDINLGILDSDELMKRLAEKFGIKSEFTEEEKQKIDSLIDTLQDSTLNRVKRNKAAYDLLKTLSGTVKVPITKLLADLWVTNVLSGINTMTSIALAVSSGAFELTSGVLRILKASIANPKELPGEISASFKSLARFLGAFPREANLAWQYLVTGDRAFLDPSMNDVLNDLNYDSIGKSVSLAERLAESDKLLEKTVGVWMRTVSRLLTALDSFNSGVTKSGAIPIVARQLELDPATLAKAEESMNLQNYKERIIQRDFGGVAPKTAREKALVDSWAKDEMMADLDQYGEFTENADFFGQQGAMTLDPSGVGGMIYRLIKSVTGSLSAGSDRFLAESQRKWQESGKSDSVDSTRLALAYALQFIAYNSANLAGLRFARFAGNKFNQGLSFIPGIGMLRLFEADLDKTHVKGKEAFMDMIQRNQFAGVMMSMVGLAILKAISDEPDDEKRGWSFNGGWANLTPDKKQQKLAAGEKEYTIRVGDKVFNYQNWPISSVLAAIGGLSDLIRYSPEQWNEKSIAGRLGSAAASGVFAASDIPALSQFQELFGSNLSSKDPNEKKLDRAARVLAGWGGGFVPRILKDFDFLAEPTIKKYDTLWERTASHIPVYRRYIGDDYYDILGKPIERKIYPGSREFMEKPSAPEYQVLGKLNSRGIWLTPANAEHRMVGRGMNRRKLTQEEADAYSLETGKGYRQMLLRYGQRALQMPTERARAFLSDKADEVRDRALKKVYRGYKR